MASGLLYEQVSKLAVYQPPGSPQGAFPMIVKSSLAFLLAGATLMFSSGCATKKYVRQQTQPIIDKFNELDALTAKNTNDIHDVDARTEQGIWGAKDMDTAA